MKCPLSNPCDCVLCRRGLMCPATDTVVVERDGSMITSRCTACGVEAPWPDDLRHRTTAQLLLGV